MKITLAFLQLCSAFFLSTSAMAASHQPSTLALHCVGAAPANCDNKGLLAKTNIETLSLAGKTDQFLVMYGENNGTRCVVSKASAAKQGVTIEMLNEMANRYQAEVTCVYVFPMQAGQMSANDFSFRASIR